MIYSDSLRSETNPKAMSQAVNLTAAASGSSGIMVADNDNINFGTGNFTVVWKGSLPDWTPSEGHWLFYKFASGNGYDCYIKTDGKIELTLYNNPNYIISTSTVAVAFVDNTEYDIQCTVVRETTSADGSVVFEIDGVQLGATVTLSKSAVMAGLSINCTSPLYVIGTDTKRNAGTVHQAITYNCALSAAEVLDLHRNGVAFADKWGSQTSLVTGNDSTFAGASNWTNQNFDSYDETTGNKLTVTASSGGRYCNLGAAYAPIVAGKKYRLQITSSSLTGQWNMGTGTIATEPQINIITTDGTFSAEFIGVSSGLFIQCDIAGTASFDNITLIEIGATLCLTSESWQSDKPYDCSSNNLTCAYPTSGWSLTRRQLMIDDEAVAMSSKAPKTATIAGDGTAGRVLRLMNIVISNGSAASTITAQTSSVWNGDANSVSGDIGKPGNSGVFSLGSDGVMLTIDATGISGDCIAILGFWFQGSIVLPAAMTALFTISAGAIQIRLYNASTGAEIDLTVTVDTAQVQINLLYLTSA